MVCITRIICRTIVLALISNLCFPAELQFIVANITHIPVCICKIEMLQIEAKKKYELIDLDYLYVLKIFQGNVFQAYKTGGAVAKALRYSNGFESE